MMVGSNLTDIQLQQIVDKTILEGDADKDGKISYEEFKKVSPPPPPLLLPSPTFRLPSFSYPPSFIPPPFLAFFLPPLFLIFIFLLAFPLLASCLTFALLQMITNIDELEEKMTISFSD